MAYNKNKGPQHSGDIQYENDPDDTKIDFEEDNIKLKAGGVNAFDITDTRLSGGVGMPLSASSFWGKFYGDGSGITGLPSAAITSYLNPAHNRIVVGSTATNAVSGAHGLDYDVTTGLMSVTGNVSASLGLSGSTLYVSGGSNNTVGTTINFTHVSSSLNISGNAFYGDGSNLTGIAGGISFNGSTANGLVTYGDASTADVESNLTFDGSLLSVTGDISGSGTLQAVGATILGNTLNVSGTVQAAQAITSSMGMHITGSTPRLSIGTLGGHGPADGMLFVRPSNDAGNNRVLALFQGASNDEQRIIFAASGSGQVFVGGAHIDGGILSVSGSTAETLITAKSDSLTNAFEVFGNGNTNIAGQLSSSLGITGSTLYVSGGSNNTVGTTINQTHISSSLNISGSKFYGDGSNLTGLPSAAISVYNTPGVTRIITSVNATSVQGEDKLTFDGSKLSATGQISASLGLSGSTLYVSGGSNNTVGTTINQTHISSSLNISGSKFYGDGSNLTGLPSAAISTYNNPGDNKIITSVNGSTVRGEDNLTFDGSQLSVTGDISGSSTMHIVGKATFGGDIATTGSVMVSGSSGLSASFGLSSGQGITTSYGRLEIDIDGSSNPRIKSNSNHLVIRNNQADKHVRVRLGDDDGDAKFQIRNDSDVTVARINSQGDYSGSLGITGSTVYVSGGVNNTVGTTINQTHVSSSLNISGAAFFGDGSNLTGVGGAVSAVANGADNRVATFSSDTALNGEANLTFDGTVLNTPGITSSVGVHITGSAPHLQVGAMSGAPSLIMLNVTPRDTDNKVLMLAQSREASGNRTIFAVTGSGKVLVGGSNTDGVLNVSGSDSETLISAKADTVGTAFTLNSAGDGTYAGQLTASLGISGSTLYVSGGSNNTVGTTINQTHVSSSLNISGNAFYGDGSNLTGIAGGISFNGSTANGLVTYGGASTADVESNLTFDGSKLSATGQISASLGLSGSTLYVSGGSNNTVGTTINQTHISSSLNISGAAFFGDGSNLTGLSSAAISNYNNAGDNKLITSVDGNTVQGEDNLTFDGSKLSVTGDISGSGTLQAVGAATLGSTLTISSSLFVGHPDSGAVVDFSLSENVNGFKVSAAGEEYFRIDTDASDGHSYFRGRTRIGSRTVAPTHTVSVTGDISGSGTLEIVGATTLGATLDTTGSITSKNQISASLGLSGSTLYVSGGSNNTVGTTINQTHISSSLNISGSKFYGDGSNLTGIATGISDVVSDTSPQLGGNLDVNGNDIVSVSNGNIDLDPNGSGKVVFKGNATKGSGQFVLNCENNSHGIIIKGPPHSAGANYTLTLPNNDGDADQVLTTNGSGDLSWTTVGGGGGGISFNGSTANGLVTYGGASTADVESNLTFDGSQLSVTGDISGSATLQAVGATTLGNNLSVSGNINVGGSNLAGAQLYVQAPSDNTTMAFFKSPSHETIFAITGSGKVAIGGAHLDGVLNVSGSDTGALISAKSNSDNPVFYVSGSGEAFAKTLLSSSYLELNSHDPTIMLTASNLSNTNAQIGINSAGNILVQNNTSNKHIVFKTSDAGTIKEGLRLDGAVPEVVVNQQAESLVNFRVESDTNTHMLYVTGSGFVGIDNADPKTALDVHHNPNNLLSDTGGGEVVKFGTGTTAVGKTYYLHSASVWQETSIELAASGGLGMLGIALGSNPATDGMLIRGFYNASTYLSGTYVPGATLYLTASGDITLLRPSGSGEILRVLGNCTTQANVIYFNPSPDYLIIT